MNYGYERKTDGELGSRLEQVKNLIQKERQNLTGSPKEPQKRIGPELFEHLLTGYYLQNSKNDIANKFRIIGRSIGQRYFVIYTQVLDESFVYPTSFDECLNLIAR